MKEKMTNTKAIQYVIDNYELPIEVQDKLNAILVLFNKRSAHKKTEEEIQQKQEARNEVLNILSRTDKKLTYSDFQITDYFKGYSTPKISRLLIDMSNEGLINREFIKKKAYYNLIEK